MAKKVTKPAGKLPDAMSMLKSVDSEIEVLNTSSIGQIDEYTSTGILLLNAIISGSLFSGIPHGRVVTLCGDSGTAKSFISVSACREFINKCKKEADENPDAPDYMVLYLDSEGAIDNDFMARLGVDTAKVAIRQVNTFQEVTTIIKNLCDTLMEQEATYGQHIKVFLVLDSLAMLTSVKEAEMAAEKNYTTRDMTKSQLCKQMMRVCVQPLAKLMIPWVVVTHVYANIGSMYGPSQVLSGGSGLIYAGSTTVKLSKLKLDDKQADEAMSKSAVKNNATKAGVTIKAVCEKSRKTKSGIAITFQIPYYKKPNAYIGLESFLSWEQGVCRGNSIEEKEYNKLSDSEKAAIHIYTAVDKETGKEKTYYVQEKQTARGIYVKHLNRQVTFQEFFSPVVFTDEFLHYIDETVIQPTFNLPSNEADVAEDLEEAIESLDSEAKQ